MLATPANAITPYSPLLASSRFQITDKELSRPAPRLVRITTETKRAAENTPA